MGTSFKKSHAHTTTQCPQPCSRPLLTHTSTRDSWTPQASLVQSLVGSLLLSHGSWCLQGFIWALWASLVGVGFDSKCDFAPPTILLGLLPNQGPSSESYGFSSSHVQIWELEHKARKNWCFWTVMLKKTLENPMDFKDIHPVNLEGNQLWIFTGRTDAEAEVPILCPPDVKSWLTGKDPDLGKSEGKRRGWQRIRWLDSITDWINMNLSKL